MSGYLRMREAYVVMGAPGARVNHLALDADGLTLCGREHEGLLTDSGGLRLCKRCLRRVGEGEELTGEDE